MERRSLFASIIAMFAAWPAQKADASPKPDKPPGFDSQGRALCHIYRRDESVGEWREIKYSDIKVGDRIICIGQNDGRLFMAHAATVEKLHGPDEWNGHTAGYEPTAESFLM